jgi:co-chaperonin GroES (HSP10)
MLDFDPDVIKRVIDKCPLVPRNDAVIVYKINLKQTAGGILLPDKKDSRSSQGFAGAGVVIAAGPGRFIDITGGREPIDLEPGDVVIFAALAGLQLGEVVRSEVGSEFSFEELVLIRAQDLLYTLRDRNVIKNTDKFKGDESCRSNIS